MMLKVKETRLEQNNWTLLYFLKIRDGRQDLFPLLSEFGRHNQHFPPEILIKPKVFP